MSNITFNRAQKWNKYAADILGHSLYQTILNPNLNEVKHEPKILC